TDDVIRAAAGNPLALLELPGVRPADRPVGIEPFPVGPRVDQAFRARLDALDPPARVAVGVVAAGSPCDRLEVAAAADRLGLPGGALHAAEDAGLVVTVGTHVDVRHPLLRSVGYHA